MALKEIKNILKKYKINVNSKINELTYIAQKISKYKKLVDVQIDLCELHSFNYQSDIIYTDLPFRDGILKKSIRSYLEK